MKAFATLLLLASSVYVRCQTFDDLDALIASGEYEQAITKARGVLGKDPSVAYPYAIMGHAYLLMAQADSMDFYLQRGILVDRDNTYISGWCHAYFGEAYTAHNEKDKALAEFLKAIAPGMKPACIARAYQGLAGIYVNQKKYDFASHYCQQAIDLDSERSAVSATCYYYLGTIHTQKDAAGMAAADWNKVIKLSRNTKEVRYAQARMVEIMSDRKQYDSAKSIGLNFIQNNPSYADPYLALGKIYFKQNNTDSAIMFLHNAILFDDDKTWVSGWSHVTLGEVYIKSGNAENGRYELQNAIRLNKTKNSAKYAQRVLDSLNEKIPAAVYQVPEPTWVTIEKEHITYKFEDTVGIAQEVTRYIYQHEAAYEKINETFQARLPKKLVFYVWNDRALAKSILHRDLGFTEPRLCKINAYIHQSVGHEMTHALSYWGWGDESVQTARLINEGVAVAFDLAGNDKIEYAKKILEGKKINSIADLWNDGNADEDVLYPAGGAFLTFILKNSTAEQFKSIIKNQSLANARIVFGALAFDKIIHDFDTLVGLK